MTSGSVTASRKSIEYVLNSKPGGNAVVVVVGGAPESLYTHPNVEDIILILKPRKGFIRLALKHGWDPVCFNTLITDVYNYFLNFTIGLIWYQVFLLEKMKFMTKLIIQMVPDLDSFKIIFRKRLDWHLYSSKGEESSSTHLGLCHTADQSLQLVRNVFYS